MHMRFCNCSPIGCAACAGRDPAAAVRLLQQLSLFPQVFTLPPQLQQQLGSDFGKPCVELMAAAYALLQELNFEVRVRDPHAAQPHVGTYGNGRLM